MTQFYESYAAAAGGAGTQVSPTSISSAEAFGNAILGIRPSGIASSEVFGSASVKYAQSIAPSTIASGEAFGSVAVLNRQQIFASGIASSESVPSPRVARILGATGIASAQAFGTPTIRLYFVVTGIQSAEAFGAAKVRFNAGNISSGESVNAPTLGLPVTYTFPEIEVTQSGGQLVATRRRAKRRGLLVQSRPAPPGWAYTWGTELIPQ